MSAKFVLKRGESDKFHFNFLSDSGRLIFSSQPYESKDAAQEGIRSVRALAARATVEDDTHKKAARLS